MENKNSYIHAINLLDQLNSTLGFASSAMRSHSVYNGWRKSIKRIQSELLQLGSVLFQNNWDLSFLNFTALEAEISAINKQLPELSTFIIPTGGEVATRLHLARSVCWQAHQEFLDNDHPCQYVDRLAYWLFTYARMAAKYEDS